jgi:hypothetical protein
VCRHVGRAVIEFLLEKFTLIEVRTYADSSKPFLALRVHLS